MSVRKHTGTRNEHNIYIGKLTGTDKLQDLGMWRGGGGLKH